MATSTPARRTTQTDWTATVNQDQKYFHTLLNQAIVFDDAPGECQEEVWAECLVIIHEAGDRAARLGLPQIVEKRAVSSGWLHRERPRQSSPNAWRR